MAWVGLMAVAEKARFGYNTIVIFCHMLIFDASTLILIAKIDLLDPFLGILSMRAAIPLKVHRECCGVKKTLDALMIQKVVDDSRIEVALVKDRKAIARIREDFSLGAGESEVIALALQSDARLVGIDDKNGINACRLLRLPFTTAAGILLICRERNLLGRSEAAEKLELLAKYGRYKNSIIEDVRTRLEEYP
jgi:predicted nucleic acid-binding protein